jgi:hypothetical protein
MGASPLPIWLMETPTYKPLEVVALSQALA